MSVYDVTYRTLSNTHNGIYNAAAMGESSTPKKRDIIWKELFIEPIKY